MKKTKSTKVTRAKDISIGEFQHQIKKAKEVTTVDAQANNEIDNLVETVQKQLSKVEFIKETSLNEIMNLPIQERLKALQERTEANVIEAKLKPINTNSGFKPTSISGSDILGHDVYINSVKEQFQNTVILWRLCDKNSVLEMPSFTRTWNTSIAKFEANKVENFKNLVGIGSNSEALKTFYNSTAKSEVTRLVETIPYFDNINLRIQGLKGKTATSKRFKYFFEHLVNSEGIVNQDLTVFIETSELNKNTDVGFNAMNSILVYNKNKTDKSVEILEAWLMYKGASKEQLETN